MLYLTLTVALLTAIGAFLWQHQRLRALLVKFEPYILFDKDLTIANSRLDATNKQYDDVLAGIAHAQTNASRLREQADRDELARRAALEQEYSSALGKYNNLTHEVSILEENIEDMSFGLYKPHYDFDTSDAYKEQRDIMWSRRKEMIRSGVAAKCYTQWTVNGSKREGSRMTRLDIKITLRAFNGESDAAIANVRWNNITRMEERIRKSFKAINETGAVNHVSIQPDYLEAVLAELRLTYEYELKKHDEKEEQRRLREKMRDEELAQREFEHAKKEAAADQARYEKALKEARAEVEKAKGLEYSRMTLRITELEAKLAEAQDRMQRAQAMAEITKMGHVYIISNIGSFGENVFKIGLTRRLDPRERVYELGGASVPFPFDIHALIFSEDAPALESAFHRRFLDNRINSINNRKEFFKLDLSEIERFASEQGFKVEFTRLAEAKQYRETIAFRLKESGIEKPQTKAVEFPAQLFNDSSSVSRDLSPSAEPLGPPQGDSESKP